jgi:hypothetical protein
MRGGKQKKILEHLKSERKNRGKRLKVKVKMGERENKRCLLLEGEKVQQRRKDDR